MTTGRREVDLGGHGPRGSARRPAREGGAGGSGPRTCGDAASASQADGAGAHGSLGDIGDGPDTGRESTADKAGEARGSASEGSRRRRASSRSAAHEASCGAASSATRRQGRRSARTSRGMRVPCTTRSTGQPEPPVERRSRRSQCHHRRAARWTRGSAAARVRADLTGMPGNPAEQVDVRAKRRATGDVDLAENLGRAARWATTSGQDRRDVRPASEARSRGRGGPPNPSRGASGHASPARDGAEGGRASVLQRRRTPWTSRCLPPPSDPARARRRSTRSQGREGRRVLTARAVGNADEAHGAGRGMA